MSQGLLGSGVRCKTRARIEIITITAVFLISHLGIYFTDFPIPVIQMSHEDKTSHAIHDL